MRILISGATGYLGQNLVKGLYKQYEVYCVVRKTSDISSLLDFIDSSRIIRIPENTNYLYDVMANIKPEVLIHLMGKFVSYHTKETIVDLEEANLSLPLLLLDAVCESGCKKIINTGSYWQNYNKESYHPVNLYAAMKEAFDRLIDYYVKNKECKAISLKLFDTYGPNDSREKLLNLMIGLKDGESIELTEGKQKVYMVYIDDVIKAYVTAICLLDELETGAHKQYSIRDENPIELRTMIETVLACKKEQINTKFGVRPYRFKEIMDPTKIGKIVPNWMPRVPLEMGIQKCFYAKEDKKGN